MDFDSLTRFCQLVQLTGYNNTNNYAIFNTLPISSRGIKCKYKILFLLCLWIDGEQTERDYTYSYLAGYLACKLNSVTVTATVQAS